MQANCFGVTRVDLSDNGLENLQVEAGTVVALTWTFVGVEKPIKAKGFTINNWMDQQDARVLVILNKYKDEKVTDKNFSNVYKLTFQSNDGIGPELNLEQKHQWDADTKKTFTTLCKGTW